MLYQIVSFLLEIASSLLGGACLARVHMQHQRVPFSNPLGRFVFALTDWLVLPLRRVMPAWGRWDVASLLAAWLVKLAQFTVLWLLAGTLTGWGWVPLLALFGLGQMALSVLTVLLVVYALLSWTQAPSPLRGVVERLSLPLLAPLRRVLPLVGGIDLSPLAALVLLQVAAMLLGGLQHALLG